MIRIPPFRSALAFIASVTLTFVTFQQTVTIPASPAASGTATHSGIA